MSGFVGADSKTSIQPSDQLDLSPLVVLNRKLHKEIILEVKKRRIVKQYLSKGKAPPDTKDVTLSSGDES